MEITIQKETESPLLSRRRITFEFMNEKKLPSRLSLIKEIAEKAKTKPELVIIKHIYTKYGSRTVKIIANIYKNRKDLEAIEEKYLIKKNSPEEPKKEEGQ